MIHICLAIYILQCIIALFLITIMSDTDAKAHERKSSMYALVLVFMLIPVLGLFLVIGSIIGIIMDITKASKGDYHE